MARIGDRPSITVGSVHGIHRRSRDEQITRGVVAIIILGVEAAQVKDSHLRRTEHQVHGVGQNGSGGGHRTGVGAGIGRCDTAHAEFVERNGQRFYGKTLQCRGDVRRTMLAIAGASTGCVLWAVLHTNAADITAGVADGVDVIDVKRGIIGPIILQHIVFVHEGFGRCARGVDGGRLLG